MPRAERPGAADQLACSVGALLFSLGLGMSSVVLPLLAFARGHDASIVGLMVTFCALVQMLARVSLGPLMRCVSDKSILAAAAVAQAGCFGLVLVTTEVWALFAAWALQGFGRAGFWTCGQTHVVRRHEGADSVRSLAYFNFFGSGGQCSGPVIAGVLVERGLSAALVFGGVMSLAALIPMARLIHTPPFERVAPASSSKIWQRSGVRLACWAGVGAGAWRSLMDSFIPVVLRAVQYSPGAVGLLMTLGNGAAVLGSLVIARMRTEHAHHAYRAAMILTGVGMAGTAALAARPIVIVASMLMIAGVAAGALQTIGPSIAALSVHPQRRGDAIALAGTFRTTAMFLAPLGVSTAAAFALPVTSAIAGGSLPYALALGHRATTSSGSDP